MRQVLVGETLVPSHPGAARGLSSPNCSPPQTAGRGGAVALSVGSARGRRWWQDGRAQHPPPPRSQRGDPRLRDTVPRDSRGHPTPARPHTGCGRGFGAHRAGAACQTPAARPQWKEPRQLPVTYGCSWSRHRPGPGQAAAEADGRLCLGCAAPPPSPASPSSFSPFSSSPSSGPPMTFPSACKVTAAPSPQHRAEGTLTPHSPPAPALARGGAGGGDAPQCHAQRHAGPLPTLSPPAALPAPGGTPGSCGLTGRGCPGHAAGVRGTRGARPPAHRKGRWAGSGPPPCRLAQDQKERSIPAPDLSPMTPSPCETLPWQP